MAALEAECDRLVALGAVRRRAVRARRGSGAGHIVHAGPRGQRVLPRLTPDPRPSSGATSSIANTRITWTAST